MKKSDSKILDNMALLFNTILLILITSSTAFDVASFFHRCKYDENFSKCAIEKSKVMIPLLAKGVPEMNIPNMMPLKLPFIQMLNSRTLVLNLTDIEIYGLETAQPLNISANLEELKYLIVVRVPKAKITGKYNFNGQILAVPLSGRGNGELILVNGAYTWQGQIKMEKRNGKEYAKVYNTHMEYTVEGFLSKLNNLDTDDVIGKHVTDFIMKNWKEITLEFRPAITETLDVFLRNLINTITSTEPFSEFFLD